MCKFRQLKKKLINDFDEIKKDDILGVFTTQNKKDTIFNSAKKLEPRFVWGNLVMKLRQNNLMTLHTACGEIRDLKIEDNVIKVNIKEEYLYNILKKEDNCATLTKLLREIDQNLSLSFVLVEKTQNKAIKNLEILKSIFGDNLLLK